MGKVLKLGEEMLRGNDNNIYIRDNDDLDDQDTDTNRGADEYPHIHIVTSGPHRGDDIVFVGITFGPNRQRANITLFDSRHGGRQVDYNDACQLVREHCPDIEDGRVPNLVRWLLGYPFQYLRN